MIPGQGTKIPHVVQPHTHTHAQNNPAFIKGIKGNIEKKNKQVLSFETIKNDQLSLKKDQGLMEMKNKIISKDTTQ